MNTKVALTIAGSDSGGGAGIQADLKTFSALGVHGLCAITSVTAQNSQGVIDTHDLPPEFIGEQIDAVAKDFDVRWAKTGMVSNSQIISKIKEKIKKYGISLVVDPVMVAADGSPLLKKEALEKMKNLLEGTKLVTPNTIEASKLSKINIQTVEDMKEAAKEITKLGTEGVLVKGGHLETEEKIHNVLLYRGNLTEYEEPRIPVSKVHGTGCTLSASITAYLTRGLNIRNAVKEAGGFMTDAVRGRLEIGKGASIVNPLARTWRVTGNGEEIEEVQKAAKMLESSSSFSSLIPEVGTNIAMGKKNAKKKNDIVGLTGRIVKVSGKPYLSGIPTFGGSEHVANIVLTAMRHDPDTRAAINIRLSKKNLRKIGNLGLKTSHFDRTEEPEDVKTMEWGTEKAIEKFGGVPDVIYDRGSIGKEPMIRILGEKATVVAEKALKVAEE